jgi:hypothetical protein
MKHWMFRCQDVSRKISQSLDEELPLGQRMAIRIHLMMCRYCALFYRQLVLLRKMSRHMDPDQPSGESHDKLSAEAKTRIKDKLRSSL